MPNTKISPLKTLTVTATGKASTKPNLAMIDFSVSTKAINTELAMKQNSQQMEKLISFLKENIVDKDLQTTGFYIHPIYEYQKEEKGKGIVKEKRILVGYEVSNNLIVKIRQIKKAGSIIEGAINNGANRVGSLRFTIDNQEEITQSACSKAIEKAGKKAKDIAKELGVKLYGIVEFREGSSSRLQPHYQMSRMAEFSMGASSSIEPTIQTGENEISATVTITYEIR